MVGIEQQVGGETGFPMPGFQIFYGAESDAEQFCILGLEFRGSITEPLGFVGSAIAKGARIEPDQHVLSRIVTQADCLPILVWQAERGWFLSNGR